MRNKNVFLKISSYINSFYVLYFLQEEIANEDTAFVFVAKCVQAVRGFDGHA